MSACNVTYRDDIFENASAEIVGVEHATQDVHPPGFDGTLVKHFGATVNRIRVRGLFTSASGTDLIAKVKARMALADSKVGLLKVPFGDTETMDFPKTRMLPLRITSVKGTPDGPVAEYEVEFVQLIPSETITFE